MGLEEKLHHGARQPPDAEKACGYERAVARMKTERKQNTKSASYRMVRQNSGMAQSWGSIASVLLSDRRVRGKRRVGYTIDVRARGNPFQPNQSRDKRL
jgi:hypothetical protein